MRQKERRLSWLKTELPVQEEYSLELLEKTEEMQEELAYYTR